ncbi:MAG TPA: 50S ribosomal protein L21 [candidate division WOR-3 bacterium]|uniref:Large ribosomal subunit protein bL21 n=1 Tax=candidate division WOR-3 bacterium TaxID=2052148 RepID=A0A9C9EPG2_UNCW3|nr:50S ribosomal protein L21 [candidate division WOR-3 bacterium]
MFAVIKTSGYQYLVSKGEKILIPARIASEGETVEFDNVLMIKDNGKTEFGQPYIKGARVKGVVRKVGRSPKVIVFKFRRRKKYRRKRGHRQDFSEVEITEIKK